MATIYLGRNNQAKKIDNLYVGINDQSKQVVKGYVGINGYSKLFYSREFYNYPQLAFTENFGITRIHYNIDFGAGGSVKSTSNSIDYIYCRNQTRSGKIERSLFLNKFYNRIYLNENSSNFFGTNLQIYYNSFETISEKSIYINSNINVETFLFNKVKNLFSFCSGKGSYSPNLIGNISNCNFINVINMFSGFYLTKVWGAPIISDNTIAMDYAFSGCYYLNGQPTCGNNVIYFNSTYGSCKNLIGSPVCGPEVINMSDCYYNCRKLSGDIAIGEKVKEASYAYYSAGADSTGLILNNLYVGKYNAINLSHCFNSCKIINGDIYILNRQSNLNYIFYGRQGSGIINIHYPLEDITDLYSRIKTTNFLTAGETHTIKESQYIQIGNFLRIYADYIES